jgi:hypothetical protein
LIIAVLILIRDDSNGLKLDSRPIKIDVDMGFTEGRQFGRGRAGGQVLQSKIGYMFFSFALGS